MTQSGLQSDFGSQTPRNYILSHRLNDPMQLEPLREPVKRSGRSRLPPSARVCNNCSAVGHIAGQCPEPSQCHCCGSIEHAVRDCPHRDQSCDICAKVGHLQNKCRLAARTAEKAVVRSERRERPARSGPPDVSSKRCNNCGVIGHLAGQCPEPAQCHCCGSIEHAVKTCPHPDAVCDLCGKVGHMALKCRQAR